MGFRSSTRSGWVWILEVVRPTIFWTIVIRVDFCRRGFKLNIEISTLTIDGGFKYFSFSPVFGEDEPILTSIFFKWVGEKPPTSWVLSELMGGSESSANKNSEQIFHRILQGRICFLAKSLGLCRTRCSTSKSRPGEALVVGNSLEVKQI